MLFEMAVAGAIAAKSNSWEFLDQNIGGVSSCVISQSYVDGTNFLFVVDRDSVNRHEFGFVASNKTWSIAEGERIGDISLKTEGYVFGSLARTGPGLFITGSYLDRLILFLRAAAISQLTIGVSERKKEIGPFSTAGLEPAVDKLETCINRHFGKSNDPFAK